MDHIRTEVESHAIDTIIGSTMVLDLGIRSWSNVAPSINASALLYDDSWRRAYVMRTHVLSEAIKKRHIGIRGMLIAASACAFLASGISVVYLGVINRWYGPVVAVAKQSSVLSSQHAAAIARPSSVGDSPKHLGVSAPAPSGPNEERAAPESNKKLAVVVDRSVAPVTVPPAKPAQPIVTVRNESITAAPPLPSSSKPFIGKRPEDFLPPAPLPMWAAKSPTQSQDAAPDREEKAMLAVDETRGQDSGEQRQARRAESSSDKPTARINQTSKAVLITEPTKEMPANHGDGQMRTSLPAYTVLAVTADGVVISDPATKLPREIKVGKTLPDGEIVKSVNAKASQVVTDRRMLKASE